MTSIGTELPNEMARVRDKTMVTVKPRKAWAIVDRNGQIHLDKVMASRAEALSILCDEYGNYFEKSPTNSELTKATGFRCVRVEIRGA